MKLADLVRKRERPLATVATVATHGARTAPEKRGVRDTPLATLATVATHEEAQSTQARGVEPPSVASVATVAVANPPTTNLQGGGKRATTWRIRYIDGTERIIATSPPRTREEVLRAETGAVEVVEHAPGKTPPDRPLLEDERTRIRRWLELIGETDPAAIAKTLLAAAEDSAARHYCLERFRDWEERAAVAEFDGGLPRQEAERLAAAHPFEATEESRAALRAARQAFGDPVPRP